MTRSTGPGLRMALAGLWLLGVGVVTLTPGGRPGAVVDLSGSMCLICGTRGAADAILNVALFLPLGLLLTPCRGPIFAAVLGLALSGSVETAQLFLPGRNPSPGDLLWNAAGAGAGVLLGRVLRRWIRSPSPLRAGLLGAALPVTCLLGAGYLAGIRGTEARYFGQWTPELGFMDHYAGELISARINGEAAPHGPFHAGAQPDITADLVVEVEVVKGPPPGRVAPVFSVFDAEQEEVLVLGVRGQDLVWRLRDRARDARFDYRETRVRGALAGFSPGDTMALTAVRQGGALCLGAGEGEWCDLGLRPEESWQYLLGLHGAPAPVRRVLGGAWMTLLFLPLGLLGGPPRRLLVLALASAVAVLMVVGTGPLDLPRWWGWGGLVMGAGLGVLLRAPSRMLLAPDGNRASPSGDRWLDSTPPP